MSVLFTTYCDRCGKEIAQKSVVIRMELNFQMDKWINDEYRNTDLCEECGNSFKKWREGK